MSFRLLDAFESLFNGCEYRHRDSTLGDYVAMHLFEDLHEQQLSPAYNTAVDAGRVVLNAANRQQGHYARRGDGTLGQVVPGSQPSFDAGYVVQRGRVAQIRIGAEVKILQKAMIKQIDRVINDLKNQAQEFRAQSGNAICVAIVGINHADYAVGLEGEREPTVTDGSRHKHPKDEAPRAEALLRQRAAHHYDEFLIVRHLATNDPPYPFSWVDYQDTAYDYGAALARIANRYQDRF